MLRQITLYLFLAYVAVIFLFAACSTPSIQSQQSSTVAKTGIEQKTHASSDKPSATLLTSSAKSIGAYQRELAIHLSQKNADKIYVGSPQALLRSVVVLKFSLDQRGNLLARDIIRSNKDRELEVTAMQSLSRSQPFPQPPQSLLKQGKIELLETWLFNSDGHFQLRTIALPQASE